ncbi:carbohydrate ABC transporter permease [soil metagenome]
MTLHCQSTSPPRRFAALPPPRSIAKHLTLLALCVWVLLPLVWVALHSMKDGPFKYYRNIWPVDFADPIWARYQWLWQDPGLDDPFFRSLTNSVMVTSLTVLATTVAAVLAGYALTHMRSPGGRIITYLLVASMFFPTQVTALVGIFKIQYELGLINKTWSLFLPYTAMMAAISVFVMRGVFLTVPRDIVDSAKLDGAGPLRTLLGVLLPMVTNGVIVVVILSFTMAWGEYLLAATLMNDRDSRTLAVGLGQAGVSPGAAALLVIALLPALSAFGFAQHWFLKGLQDGALRG